MFSKILILVPLSECLMPEEFNRVNCLFVRGFSMKVKFKVMEVAACPVIQGLLSCVCRNYYVTLPVFDV